MQNTWSLTSSSLLLQRQFSSVEARMCEMVPKRWKIMATNWMMMIREKKNTRTIPMGSRWRYSFVTRIWNKDDNSIFKICTSHFSKIYVKFVGKNRQRIKHPGFLKWENKILVFPKFCLLVIPGRRRCK